MYSSNEDIFGFGQQALPPAVVIPVEVVEETPDPHDGAPRRQKSVVRSVAGLTVNKRTAVMSLIAGFSVLFIGSLLIASQADDLDGLRSHSLQTAGQSVALLSGLATLGCFLRGVGNGES